MDYLSTEQKTLLKQADEYQKSRQGKGDDQMWFFHTGVLLGIIAHLMEKLEGNEKTLKRPGSELDQNFN